MKIWEQLLDQALIENPDSDKRKLERQYAAMSELEIEEAAKQEILIYQDETHIPRVVTNLENWESQSQNREFNAILTVAYKSVSLNFIKFKSN